jgi:hypothetical protein
MTSHHDVENLMRALELSARNGSGIELAAHFVPLLLDALRACAEAADRQSDLAAFQIDVVDVESGHAEVVGISNDPAVAKAIFDAAVAQSGKTAIRLIRGMRILSEKP